MVNEQQTAWDSRDKWTSLLISRIELVLNSDQADLTGWYEHLRDLYDISACALDDPDKTDRELQEVDKLIHGAVVDNRRLTDKERKDNKVKAYTEMRRIFRDIHYDLYVQGLLIPFQPKRNPRRAIANYYEVKA